MSNSFSISPKPYFDECKVILEDNQTNIQDMHNFHLPEISTLATDIKAKTDLTPQNVRGAIYQEYLFTENSALTDVVNVTGQGRLLMLTCLLLVDTDEIEIMVIVDDVTFVTFFHTGDVIQQYILPYLDILYTSPSLFSIVAPLTAANIFNIEFDTSLVIKCRRSTGTGDVVKCAAVYQLDEF